MTTFFIHFEGGGDKKTEGEKCFLLKSVYKSRMLLKKEFGFWIYVFGFSWCNGLIINSISVGPFSTILSDSRVLFSISSGVTKSGGRWNLTQDKRQILLSKF